MLRSRHTEVLLHAQTVLLATSAVDGDVRQALRRFRRHVRSQTQLNVDYSVSCGCEERSFRGPRGERGAEPGAESRQGAPDAEVLGQLRALRDLHLRPESLVCVEEICMFFLEGKCQRPLVAQVAFFASRATACLVEEGRIVNTCTTRRVEAESCGFAMQ